MISARAQGEVFRIEGTQDGPYAAVDPRRMRIEAAAGASGRIVVVHTAPDMSSLEVVAAEDARLEITEVFLAEAFAEVAVKQSARSLCRLTAVQLTSANVSYTIDLDGRDAENMLGGVFLAGGENTASSNCARTTTCPTAAAIPILKALPAVRPAASSADWSMWRPMRSIPDAQQQNPQHPAERDGAISPPQPQAGDICRRREVLARRDGGADGLGSRAYMRQRGLSEVQARRLQIEGFVGDVVRRCGVEPLCETMMEAVRAKMEKL